MGCKIGFVGLGTMGRNLVRRLLETGFEVTGYDIDRENAERSARDGAKTAGSLAELAEEADLICTSLPDPASVADVYRGAGGLVEHARPGSILIDFSTVDPFTSRENDRAGRERGLAVYDCPVSGGPNEAAAGSLIVFAGGDPERFPEIRPLLDKLGRLVHYIGPGGSGATVKMINNAIANGTVLLTAEAFVLGVKLGIDPDVLFNTLITAGARSHHFEKRFPKALADNFAPAFKLDLARKDVALALEAGRKVKMPLPVASLIHELYAAGSALGYGEEDYVAIIKYFEQLAGVKARSRKPQS